MKKFLDTFASIILVVLLLMALAVGIGTFFAIVYKTFLWML